MSAARGHRGTSNGKERTKSPAARRDRSAAAHANEEALDVNSLGDLSKEVSHYLSSLNTSCQNKISLIRMQIIRCDENSSMYSRLRGCLNSGNIDDADHYLASLEESNYQAQQDLKNEVQDGPKASATIGMLCEQLKKERVEAASASRGRSPAKYANAIGGRNRSTSANRNYANGPDVKMLKQQIGELRRNLAKFEGDNDKLKETMREMVDDYTRQLVLRDETIGRLESSQPPQDIYKRQIQDLEDQVRILRDKNVALNRELDQQSGNGVKVIQLQDENARLVRELDMNHG